MTERGDRPEQGDAPEPAAGSEPVRGDVTAAGDAVPDGPTTVAGDLGDRGRAGSAATSVAGARVSDGQVESEDFPEPPGPPRGFGGAKGIAPARWGVNQVLLGLLVAAGAILIGVSIVGAVDPSLDSEAGALAAQAIVALALVGVAVAIANSAGPGRPLQRLGFRRVGWGAVGLAFAAWLGYIIVAAQIAQLVSPEQEDVTRSLGVDESTIGLVIAGFLIVVAAPISEEVFFRGFMFAGIRRRIPLWPAAFISAAFWGLLHLSGGNLGVVALLTVFGLLLAWLYEQTGSLWPPIIAHAFNNALAFTVLVAG